MRLLRIATPETGLPDGIGALPGGSAGHRLILDPKAGLATATASTAAALRDHRAAWVIVAGRATAPLLAAVAADLSLAVAGALILHPAPWAPNRMLPLSPLAFPAFLLADPGDMHRGRDLARAWGARLLAARISGPLLSDPAVAEAVTRRARDLTRAYAAAPSRSA